ncbi:MAG: dihydropteroate synthase [Planctomycetaceae bacterium]|jgi:5-methyltetrahydrofolate--homocysteine methyltransferase|nr:dihydropteroate synthase [Planctomycetaceae bacterium]
MSKAPVKIIAESINDSVPSTHELYESGNMDGIRELAKFQDEKGGVYIDVNVGGRPAEFMAEVIREVQSVTRKPLSIDTPDPALAEAALKVYDDSVGLPVLNSISPLRTEMFGLYKLKPFRPILLISEKLEDGNAGACHTAQETFDAARFLIAEARKQGIRNEDVIFDPGIAPIGTDSEGNLGRLLTALQMIHDDPDFSGFHASVGLSNFTVMLPPKRPDGSPVKGPLESAFLTRAMPLGLDYVIGSVKRNYEILADEHPAMQCVEECIKLGSFDSIMRVRKFYKT